MRNDKHLALKLRLENKSYGQISRALKVSKSTLSVWLRSNSASQKITEYLRSKQNPAVANNIKLMNERNRVKWECWREEARQEALKEFPKFSKNNLFCSGLSVYWSEGDGKPKNPLRFANTDPRMVKVFIKFLKFLSVPLDKIRISLLLYPDLDEKKCVQFWCSITGVPPIQFYKTQVIQGRHPTARLEYGVCSVTVTSRWLKIKFLAWIDLLSKNL